LALRKTDPEKVVKWKETFPISRGEMQKKMCKVTNNINYINKNFSWGKLQEIKNKVEEMRRDDWKCSLK
jgi:hypothetical protein